MYAIGYDYIVDTWPNIRTVLLPTGIGDNLFDLWLFDSLLGGFVDTGIDIMGGVVYEFGVGGVDLFRIMGVELNAMLDPTDTPAFVTGLTFTGVGAVSMRQIPITFEMVTPSSVPEPASMVLFAISLTGLMLSGIRRRRKNHSLN